MRIHDLTLPVGDGAPTRAVAIDMEEEDTDAGRAPV
jgi:hypothetical protein